MTRSAPDPRNKRPWLIMLVVALVLGAICFGAGYYLGRTPVPQLQGDVETARAEVLAVREDLQAVRLLAAVQSARAELYQGAADLDRRNFGIANERLRAAGEDLALALTFADGELTEPLTQLQQGVEETNLSVAEDLQQQRGRVLGLAGNLTSLAEELAARN